MSSTSRRNPMIDTHVEQFQRWLEETYTGDERFGAVHRLHENGVDAGVRLEAGEGSYYEIAARLARRDVRVGFLTADRALNETIEQGILDSGDSLEELLEVELDDLGEPPAPMEHFFERPAFCYTTTLPVSGPEALDAPDLRRRLGHLIDACCILFREYLE
jgi:hypothetical protein